MKDDFLRARAKNGGHTGASARVREALERVGKPQTINRLAELTGLKPQQAKRAVCVGITNGGIVRVRSSNGGLYYDIWKPAAQSEPKPDRGEFAVAGRIVIGRGTKWGAGLV